MSNRRISKTTGRSYEVDMMGLEVGTYRKRQRWQIDQDYIEKLKKQAKSSNAARAIEATEALRYISRFNEEMYKGKVSVKDSNRIHQSQEMVRDCYRANGRNYCDVGSILSPVSLNSFSGEDTETSDGEKVLNEYRETLEAKYGNYTEDLLIRQIDTCRRKGVR